MCILFRKKLFLKAKKSHVYTIFTPVGDKANKRNVYYFVPNKYWFLYRVFISKKINIRNIIYLIEIKEELKERGS